MIASSVSERPKDSTPPASTSATSPNGLTAERRFTTVSGSPTTRRTVPSPATSTIEPRWRLSTTPPRTWRTRIGGALVPSWVRATGLVERARDGCAGPSGPPLRAECRVSRVGAAVPAAVFRSEPGRDGTSTSKTRTTSPSRPRHRPLVVHGHARETPSILRQLSPAPAPAVCATQRERPASLPRGLGVGPGLGHLRRRFVACSRHR